MVCIAIKIDFLREIQLVVVEVMNRQCLASRDIKKKKKNQVIESYTRKSSI